MSLKRGVGENPGSPWVAKALRLRSLLMTDLRVALVFCGFLGLGACACSHYGLASSLPGHIKTVAIPLFEDRAFEYGVAERLTDAVVAEFSQDHTLSVVDEQRADSVLEGVLTRVDDEAMTYTANEEVEERKVRLRLDVSFYDRRKKRVIWEREGVEDWASYDPSDASARDAAIGEAVAKLARQMTDLTLSDW